MRANSAQITRLDPGDLGTVTAMYDVQLAAHQVDSPEGPPWSHQIFRTQVTLGPPLAEPHEAWVIPDEESPGVAGWYSMMFPDKENKKWAVLMLTVHPARRRQGLGTALLRHAAQRAAASGRTGIAGLIRHQTAAEPFAIGAGTSHGIDEIERVLDVRAVPAARHRKIREAATRAATGYSLVSWDGPTPEEHMAGIAVMFNTMNDAPMNEDEEPSVWDADRVRLDDERVAASGRRRHVVAAIHDASGEMAGYTELRVAPDLAEWGFQGNTAVARPHRGHRLGLLLKAAMLEGLAAAEPQVTRIETWNAASNAHMIAVNEELGYEVCGTPGCFGALQVSRVLGVTAGA